MVKHIIIWNLKDELSDAEKQERKQLIKQGLVTKTPDPDDRRKNYLTVNEEAVPQYKIYRYQDNEAVRRITEKYSGEEIRMFCDMLDMISEINFEELKGE